MSDSDSYRLGVVGVFIDAQGKILVCERANRRGAWQFPQGGIDEGEDPDQAVLREMREELGCDGFEIVKKHQTQTTYDFPKEAAFPLARDFRGQKHFWFLLRFLAGVNPDLEKCDGEFCAFKWVSADAALDEVIYWKRDAYREGLELLGLLNR